MFSSTRKIGQSVQEQDQPLNLTALFQQSALRKLKESSRVVHKQPTPKKAKPKQVLNCSQQIYLKSEVSGQTTTMLMPGQTKAKSHLLKRSASNFDLVSYASQQSSLRNHETLNI